MLRSFLSLTFRRFLSSPGPILIYGALSVLSAWAAWHAGWQSAGGFWGAWFALFFGIIVAGGFRAVAVWQR